MEVFRGTEKEKKRGLKMEYNILILSAGRRVELVKCFQKAAKRLNIKSKIVAADISDMAPAIYFADKHYLIPKIGEKNYIRSILIFAIKKISN